MASLHRSVVTLPYAYQLQDSRVAPLLAAIKY